MILVQEQEFTVHAASPTIPIVLIYYIIDITITIIIIICSSVDKEQFFVLPHPITSIRYQKKATDDNLPSLDSHTKKKDPSQAKPPTNQPTNHNGPSIVLHLLLVDDDKHRKLHAKDYRRYLRFAGTKERLPQNTGHCSQKSVRSLQGRRRGRRRAQVPDPQTRQPQDQGAPLFFLANHRARPAHRCLAGGHDRFVVVFDTVSGPGFGGRSLGAARGPERVEGGRPLAAGPAGRHHRPGEDWFPARGGLGGCKCKPIQKGQARKHNSDNHHSTERALRTTLGEAKGPPAAGRKEAPRKGTGQAPSPKHAGPDPGRQARPPARRKLEADGQCGRRQVRDGTPDLSGSARGVRDFGNQTKTKQKRERKRGKVVGPFQTGVENGMGDWVDG